MVHTARTRREAEWLLAHGAELLPGRPGSFNYTDPHTKQCVRTWQKRCCVARRMQEEMQVEMRSGGYTDNSRMWQPDSQQRSRPGATK